jgi:hypothetical protein
MRVLTGLLIAILVAAGVLPAVAEPGDPSADPSASPSASPTALPEPAVYPVFNYPTPGTPDPAINSELTRLLTEVPSGAQVSAALFVVAPNYPVVDALLAAHARGVAVRVVLDSGDGQSATTNQAVDETYARLAPVLGTDITAPSFIVQCVTACISKEPDSINHNKYVLMSGTGALTDVVFQSTANIRSDGSGDAAWNAATVSSGSPGLYSSYLTYFGNLAARATVPGNDYNAVQPPTRIQPWVPYYFPRTDGIDSVSQTLMGVNCALSPTTVDVMASFFTRPKVRNRLNEMAAAGCTVRIIARTDSITREFCDSLRPPVAVRIADRPSATKVGIHGKYLTIAGGFEDDAQRRVVWMGSQNFTRNALVRNDETFLLVDDNDLHARFAENFDRIWNDPSLTPGCGRAGGVSEEVIEEEANEEATPLIKERQRVSRTLPKRLKKRTALKTTRTVQGQRVTTTVKCRVRGSAQKWKKRPACALKKPKRNPTVVLTPKRRQVLRVRIVQTAPGTAMLERFRRERTYTYRR